MAPPPIIEASAPWTLRGRHQTAHAGGQGTLDDGREDGWSALVAMPMTTPASA